MAMAIANEAEASKECCKVQVVFQLQNIGVIMQQTNDCRKFSKWRRLIRVTAWMIKFVDDLKAKVIAGRLENQSSTAIKNGSLTPNEFKEAELLS